MLSPELFLPASDDLDAVLANQLVPLGIGGTEKFKVSGHPDLLVRRDINLPDAKIQQADRGYMNLRLKGVDVSPYAVAPKPEGLYVVTYKVDGQPLEDMMRPGQDAEIIDQVDRLYSQLGGFLLDAWWDGKQTATDVFGPQQYMYGSVRGGRPGVKFVDLDMRPGRISNFPGELSREAIDIANDIVNAEAKFGQPERFTGAREMVRSLFTIDLERSAADPATAALRNLGSLVLEKGVPTDDHINDTEEELIDKYGSAGRV